MRMTRLAPLIAALAVTGCSDAKPTIGTPLAGAVRATALFHSTGGMEIGRATATEVAGGLRITIDVSAMPTGRHGAHVHAVGRCDAPDFLTAGAHWNPTGARHGSMNPQGPHGGDLPNLLIGTDGRGTLGITLPGATMAGLLDADGAALVIHAAADDLVTDPAGNSGARIACGVFAPG